MVSIKDVNRIWLLAVLIHIGGSLLAAYAQIIPGGSFLVCLGIGLGAGWLAGGGKWYQAAAGGIAVPLFFYLVTWGLPSGYRASMLLLMVEMDLILWLRAKNYISLGKYCRIRPVGPLQLMAMLLSGCLMYFFCAYFNAWSEVVFRNYVGESLTAVGQNIPGSLLIFALMPALMEENLFRGILFQGMGAGRKAALVTALLFALMHMNFNQMIYAFAAGMLLSTVILVTGNLTLTMGMHFVFNGLSVLVTSLLESSLVQGLLSVHIGSYYPLTPVLYEKGHLLPASIGTGFLVAVLCFLAILFLMKTLGKTPTGKEGQAAGEDPSVPGWTGPDWHMVTGCLICLAFALSRELM